ncbi:hypothetical protein A3A95_00120 [Candidatus Nomurabacteria bacterium RIFCSPLOWO2_01_FULL_39_18]|uniref:Uncharacterized protein n=1 Tax=Candidatus Nomurabacteria bacterium RIFCSPHIGHO2_01_FULL_40_20 TaxID=1801738 RepID=A0A1F6V2D2_9BACT|nr:MAG: hypothetical protein A2733_00760 [Candidatus Nomurabacteria bacterium RIFCSPHIGHO2_01_FULL_40_20]OGI89014.1 MAG: hypothetical protein A3A95_00120 [Candidatus Nomurabacteria bacterium RIFCSPLOWO2_01_FULL_39_18]
MGNGPEDLAKKGIAPVVEHAVSTWSPEDIQLVAQWKLDELRSGEGGYKCRYVRVKDGHLSTLASLMHGDTEDSVAASGYLPIENPQLLDRLIEYYQQLSVKFPREAGYDLEKARGGGKDNPI